MAKQISILLTDENTLTNITVVDTSQPGIPLVGKVRELTLDTFNTTTTNQINTAINKILTEFNKSE